MYVDIWDIEIITHAAAAAAGERDTADKGGGGEGSGTTRGTGSTSNRTISCRCFSRVRTSYLREHACA